MDRGEARGDGRRGEQARREVQGEDNRARRRGLLELLEARDAFTLRYEGAMEYCGLRYSANSVDPISKRLYEAVRKAGNKAGQALAFMEIELGALLKAKPVLVKDSKLKEYSHLLERVVLRIPHVMTEELEKLTISKDQNGVSAWSQLQGDWLSTRKFKILVDGVEKTMPYGEIIALYQSRDRALRQEANRVVYDGLGKDDIVWASAIRSVCGDHLQMCEWRKYAFSDDAEPHRQRRRAGCDRRPHEDYGGQRRIIPPVPPPQGEAHGTGEAWQLGHSRPPPQGAREEVYLGRVEERGRLRLQELRPSLGGIRRRDVRASPHRRRGTQRVSAVVPSAPHGSRARAHTFSRASTARWATSTPRHTN